MNRILRALKKSAKCWKDIFLRYKEHKFRPSFLEEMLHSVYGMRNVYGDYYRLDRRELGKENTGMMVGLIRFPKEWNETAGFFALFNRMMCGLYFADQLGLVPVVANWDLCPYEEDIPVNDTSIVFQYFFNPLSKVTLESAFNSKNLIIISNQNMDIAMFENKSEWFQPNEDFIETMGALYRKYISLNASTEARMTGDIQKLFTHKSTLGIHFRGTDYQLNVNGHPVSLKLEDYFPFIEEAMKKYKFHQIFLATDDKNALEIMKKKYPKIVFFGDTNRAEKTTSVAYQSSDRKFHKSNLAYEVLRDSYALAQCDGIIGGFSQVAINSRIIRASQEKEFIFSKFLSKGVNNNNIEWMDYFQENVKK